MRLCLMIFCFIYDLKENIATRRATYMVAGCVYLNVHLREFGGEVLKIRLEDLSSVEIVRDKRKFGHFSWSQLATNVNLHFRSNLDRLVYVALRNIQAQRRRE